MSGWWCCVHRSAQSRIVEMLFSFNYFMVEKVIFIFDGRADGGPSLRSSSAHIFVIHVMLERCRMRWQAAAPQEGPVTVSRLRLEGAPGWGANQIQKSADCTGLRRFRLSSIPRQQRHAVRWAGSRQMLRAIPSRSSQVILCAHKPLTPWICERIP